jgi:glutamate transport system permease protein
LISTTKPRRDDIHLLFDPHRPRARHRIRIATAVSLAVLAGQWWMFGEWPIIRFLLYVFLFGLPGVGLTFPVFWQLVIPLVLGNAAVVAEIFRAGVLSLPRGQTEAAHSLGMTHRRTMACVVVPQAVRAVSPALVSQLVRLLKDSTLGYVVNYLELLHQAKVLGEYYHAVLSTYLVAAACFIAVNAALSRAASWLEARRA